MIKPTWSRVPTGSGINVAREGTVLLEFASAVGERNYDWENKGVSKGGERAGGGGCCRGCGCGCGCVNEWCWWACLWVVSGWSEAVTWPVPPACVLLQACSLSSAAEYACWKGRMALCRHSGTEAGLCAWLGGAAPARQAPLPASQHRSWPLPRPPPSPQTFALSAIECAQVLEAVEHNQEASFFHDPNKGSA